MRLDDPPALRRTMLRLMLGALAASAALAVLAVLSPRGMEPYRMIGTAIATAAVSALLARSSRLLDSEKTRRAGLLEMALILAQFILALLALWNPFTSQDQLVFTAILFPVAAVPSLVLFHFRFRAGGRLASNVGISLCAAAYAWFLVAIWRNNPGFGQDDQWASAWLCLALALVVAANLGGAGTDKRYWRWIGVAAAVAAFVLGLGDSWNNFNQTDDLFVALATLAILIGHANLLLLCQLKPAHAWLRWATIACAWVGGAIFDYAIISNINFDQFIRGGLAAGICASSGTIAIALLVVFNRKILPVRDVLDLKELTLICPVCRKKQTIAVAASSAVGHCDGCGINFSIQLTLPRCPKCDYSLLMLKSDRCPECGTPIPANPVPPLLPGIPEKST